MFSQETINKENMRLLKNILNIIYVLEFLLQTPKKCNLNPSKLTSSTINKDKEKRKISIENMAMLQTIQNAKPFLTRSDWRSHFKKVKLCISKQHKLYKRLHIGLSTLKARNKKNIGRTKSQCMKKKQYENFTYDAKLGYYQLNMKNKRKKSYNTIHS